MERTHHWVSPFSDVQTYLFREHGLAELIRGRDLCQAHQTVDHCYLTGDDNERVAVRDIALERHQGAFGGSTKYLFMLFSLFGTGSYISVKSQNKAINLHSQDIWCVEPHNILGPE